MNDCNLQYDSIAIVVYTNRNSKFNYEYVLDCLVLVPGKPCINLLNTRNVPTYMSAIKI